MALLVLCDPKYKHAAWCDTKLRGIMDEAARRRIQPEVFTDLSAAKVAADKCGEDSSLILLFDSLHWLQEIAEAFANSRIHLILSANFLDIDLPISYSLVGTDSDGAMRAMVDYLHACGKRRIAMVGVNPNSCNDRCRVSMLRRYVPAEEHRIFYAEEDMQDCFEAFLAMQNEFDTAICTNDFLAICLLEHLKTHPRVGDKLFVISHTDTVMARLYGDGITSMTVNFYNCGRALVETHFNRVRYGWACAQILLPAELKVRGSTDSLPYRPSADLPRSLREESLSPARRIRIPTGNISKLERVLAVSDLTDLKLIYCMLAGYSYEKMGEFCFFSVDTAKYRVRKIKQSLGVQKKSDAAARIREYIKKERLLSVISEMEEQNNQIPL